MAIENRTAAVSARHPLTYTPHTGVVCPLPAATIVAVDLGEGPPIVGRADCFAWGGFHEDAGRGRIHRYRRATLDDVAAALHGAEAVLHV